MHGLSKRIRKSIVESVTSSLPLAGYDLRGEGGLHVLGVAYRVCEKIAASATSISTHIHVTCILYIRAAPAPKLRTGF